MLVFAAWDQYDEERIDVVFNTTAEERNLPSNAFDELKKRQMTHYNNLGADWQENHTSKQSYIALGIALVAAAERRIDATPMEGFDPDKLDEILNLKQLGLKSTVILALGYRNEAEDWLVNQKKVRTPKNDFIIEFN